VVEAGRPGRLNRGKRFGRNSFDLGQFGNPDLIDGMIPGGLHIKNAYGLTVGGTEGPATDCKAGRAGRSHVYSPSINEALSKYISRAGSSWITVSGTRFAICTMAV
jgi:hypothetical protein